MTWAFPAVIRRKVSTEKVGPDKTQNLYVNSAKLPSAYQPTILRYICTRFDFS